MAAASSFRELQDRTLDLLSKSDATTRARVKNWINLGQSDFVMRELWPFREATENITTASGTQEYDLTNLTDIDSQNILSVSIQGTNEKKLSYIPFNQLRASNPDFDADATAVPRNYYFKAGQIGFWPAPAAAYTIAVDYYIVPTEMSNDTDTPIIPVNYREALIHYALSLENDFNTDPDLALKEMNRYEEILTLARNNLLNQPSDTGAFTILGPADFRNHTGLRNEIN